MKNILVTGGLGFIGFNAVQLWKKAHPEYNYFIIDAETYAAKFKLEQKHEWLKANGISCFKCDICDEFAVEAIVQQFSIDTVVNFAAESHVDNSIASPDVFFQTNVVGVTKLLNIATKHSLRFHQIGTDEVYGETVPASWKRCKSAKDMPLAPSSPYSSSKASADMIALSYWRTYGTKVTVSRCTNNFGPWQHDEKLVGTVIRKAASDKMIPVYGKGSQKRHWIYVDEHNKKIMHILQEAQPGTIWNVAPCKANWISNMKLITFILKQLKKPLSLVQHVADRPGHDASYFLEASEGCYSDARWQDGMKTTVQWYKDNAL